MTQDDTCIHKERKYVYFLEPRFASWDLKMVL